MADYRSGHFAKAIERLNKSLSLEREYRFRDSLYITGTAQLFLAMAHQQPGQADEARHVLKQATEPMEQMKIDRNAVLGPDWHIGYDSSSSGLRRKCS